jgi:hypothetical protein
MKDSRRLLGSISREFEGAEIPDWRLRDRLLKIAENMDVNPEATLPKSMKTTASREAAYRFLGNRKVTLDRILGPHVQATASRCLAEGTVYVASDTTECAFEGEQRGKRLGRLQGNSRGFLAHVALAISADGTRQPLGVLDIDTWVREEHAKEHRNVYHQKKDPERESLKWGRTMVKAASALPPGVTAIHVMDSEADIYELLHQAGGNHRYIIRSGQERRVVDGLLSDTVARTQTVLTREVRLSRRNKASNRRNPPRAGRLAKLAISSAVVHVKRPKTSSSSLPAELPVNLVCVRETEAPDGESPVEWILFTSEPVDTEAEIAAVIDGYRTRWVIEEYFKALKTGCKYEDREFESMRTLTNFLGIAAVVAWRLLLIRSIQRANSNAAATDLVDAELLEALAARLKKIGERRPLPAKPTVTDLMNGIARLGGHITSNGPPGWLVLWRGYHDLLSWGDGFIHGKITTYSDLS